MYLSLALVSGGLIALMILVNGDLQSLVGPLPALLFIHSSGLLASTVYVSLSLRGSTARRRPETASDGKPAAPLWFAAAGILGIAVVFLNNLIFSKGGVLLALGGTLAGQTLFAHLLEGTRWFDRRRSPVLQRVLSLGLVLPGAAIIGLRSGVGAGWVALSWLPGAILMVQSMMNARNALRWGQARMVLFNYSSALLVLIPLFAFAGGALSTTAGATGLLSPGYGFAGGRLLSSGGSWALILRAITNIPIYDIVGGGLIGVVIVGSTAFLLNRASALKVVLGLYTGQILIGILLDALSGLALQPEKVAGVVMVLVGLGAGEVHRLRRQPPTGPARSSNDDVSRLG